MSITPLITDVEGERLTAEEKRFITQTSPYGVILFKRNCVSSEQVRSLTAELRDATGRADLPILIDQEGGRVARLRPPLWRACPAAGQLAQLGAAAAQAIYVNARLMAEELRGLGINVDCAPVADLRIEGAHEVIGDRAYGSDPAQVAKLAGEMARGLQDGGVVPIVKHIPGHGRAKADSHHELPVVDTALAELERTDFEAFRLLKHIPMAMTAHVVYTALDTDRPATQSPAVLRYIRESMQYDGLIMSDEITMKALSGSIEERAQLALAAGCDVVMHCNGINLIPLEEKRRAAGAVAPMSEQALARSARAFAAIGDDKGFDAKQAEAQLAALMAGSAAA